MKWVQASATFFVSEIIETSLQNAALFPALGGKGCVRLRDAVKVQLRNYEGIRSQTIVGIVSIARASRTQLIPTLGPKAFQCHLLGAMWSPR